MAEPPRLSDFVHDNVDSIVAAWRERVRSRLPTQNMSDRALDDHLPLILRLIADLADHEAQDEAAALRDAPRRHATDRLAHGFALDEIIREYATLRGVVVELWEKNIGDEIRARELKRLDAAFDEAIRQSSLRYTRARERMVVAVDRIADAAFGTTDLDGFLERLLHATLELTESVTTAAVLLKSGDTLKVRAAAGLEGEHGRDYVMGVHQGFSGAVVSRRAPILLAHAALDPLIQSEAIRKANIKALYGVPLLHGGEIIGVAHIGSAIAEDFSEEDLLLFRMMTSRATAVIVQSQLLQQQRQSRAEAERALALVDSLLAAAPVGVAFVDRDLRYVRVNDALAAMNGQPARAHIGKTIDELMHEGAAGVAPILRRVLDSGEPVMDLEVDSAPPSAPHEPPRSYLASFFPVRKEDGDVLGVGATVMDITARKRMEAEMRATRRRTEETNALLELILSRSPVGFALLDEELRYVRLNDALARSHGVPVEAHLGRRPSAVLEPGAGRVIEDGLREALTTGAPVHGRMVSLRAPATGREVHWLMSFFPIPRASGEDGGFAGVAKIAVDVTERKKAADAQEFLAAASVALSGSLDFTETLRAIARLTVPALCDLCMVDVRDRDHVRPLIVVHADPHMAELATRMRSEFPPRIGAPSGVARVLRTGEAELHPDIHHGITAGLTYSDEHARLLARLDMGSAVIVPLHSRGQILGALSLIRSKTRAAFSPDDLEMAKDLAHRVSLAAENARLYGEAQQAIRMREEILAVVSHDLKNPLSSIALSTALVAQRVDDDGRLTAVKRHCETVQRAVTRMDRLIGDLLTMASIQAGRLGLDKTRVPVSELLDEVVALHGPLAQEKGIALEVERGAPERALAAVIHADRDRLLQVFSNLLGNAVKFSEPGARVAVGAALADDDHSVELHVTDSGPGIDAAQLPHIFDPYWSAGRGGQRGTGLGLFIAKGIVESHGGHMTVRSAPGEGSTFLFSIPRAP